MIGEFNKIEKVNGKLNIQGDKSISHRAVLFSALAKGKSLIENISNSEDVKATLNSVLLLGAKIKFKGKFLEIEGINDKSLQNKIVFNAKNSGTTARLLPAILINQKFFSKIVGDSSLQKRPMIRIVEPLLSMGANIKANKNGTLPIEIYPSDFIHSINYYLPIPSAQVKSCVLIAGLFLENPTCVNESIPSRNHTELMLGLKTNYENGLTKIFSSSKNYPSNKKYFIPNDISTASFFIVLALLKKKSELIIKDVLLNPTRTGFIEILKKMGADIKIISEKKSCNEKYGSVLVRSSLLQNIKIEEEIIPNIIDEIPVLTIAGLFAEGNFEIKNAEELRKKESDRINSICYNLRLLGLKVDEYKDGFTISGEIKNVKPKFESFGDHRIAMAFGILSLILEEGGKVNNFDCVKISNPNFLEQLKSITR